jgi:hypothetical protein
LVVFVAMTDRLLETFYNVTANMVCPFHGSLLLQTELLTWYHPEANSKLWVLIHAVWVAAYYHLQFKNAKKNSVLTVSSPMKTVEWLLYLFVCYVATAPGKILRTLLLGQVTSVTPLHIYTDFMLLSTLIIAIFLPIFFGDISSRTVSMIGIFNIYSTIFGMKSGANVAMELFPTSLFMLFYCTFVSGIGGVLLRVLVLHLLRLPWNLSDILRPSLIKILLISFVWCYSTRCSLPLSRGDVEWLLFVFCVTYDLYKLQFTQFTKSSKNDNDDDTKTKKQQ